MEALGLDSGGQKILPDTSPHFPTHRYEDFLNHPIFYLQGAINPFLELKKFKTPKSDYPLKEVKCLSTRQQYTNGMGGIILKLQDVWQPYYNTLMVKNRLIRYMNYHKLSTLIYGNLYLYMCI